MKKRILILSLLLCVATGLMSSEWISFGKDATFSKKPMIVNISSSHTYVDIGMQVFGAQWEEIKTDWMIDTKNETFALFTIPHYAYTGEIGKPKLPMVTGVIEVPHKAKIEVKIIKANYKK